MSGWRSALTLLALLVLVAGLAQTSQGHSLLKDAGIYQEPASYTELTFTAPGKLPEQLTSKRTPVAVAFRIHNVSGASRSYRWSITVVRSSKGHQATAGVVQAPAQREVKIVRIVVLACTGGRLQVVVGLVDPAQSIDFWVTCPPAKLGAQ